MNYPMLPNEFEMLPTRPTGSMLERAMSAVTNGIASPILTYQHNKNWTELTRQAMEYFYNLEMEKEKSRQKAMQHMAELWARGDISSDKYYMFLIANSNIR